MIRPFRHPISPPLSAFETLEPRRFLSAGIVAEAGFSGAPLWADEAQSVDAGPGTPMVTSTVSMTISKPSARYGQAVRFTVAVTNPTDDSEPTGTIGLFDGPRFVGRGDLVDGRVVITVANLPVGTYSISAGYLGDDEHTPASSPVRPLTITRAAPSLVLSSSSDVIYSGRAVTITATLNAPDTVGPPTGTIMLRDGGRAVGTATLSGRDPATFTLSSLSAGRHSLTATYSGAGPFLGATSAPLVRTVRAASVIDLMVVYTPAARVDAGGAAAIRSTIKKAVADANVAYANSDVAITLRLVYSGQVAYTETGRLDRDLDRLRAPHDGYMDEVHPLRDIYRADVVSLFEADADNGGLAYELTDLRDRHNDDYAFSVVLQRQAAAPVYTLAHELGHNLGAAHDTDHADDEGLFSYSYGYRFRADGTLYHDIMAYDPGMTIPYFANPRVSYKGVPTGDSQTSDVARTFNTSAPIVAAYR